LEQPDSRFRDVGAFKLGFVGGTGVGFSFVMGPFANLLVSRFGIRTPALLGVILMTIACQLASISTKFWQLLLSQGILFGYAISMHANTTFELTCFMCSIGGSLTFLSSIGLPAQWFDKKRSLATGLAAVSRAFLALVSTL
jgi:MFS family permease